MSELAGPGLDWRVMQMLFKLDSWPEWNSPGFQEGIRRAELPQPRGFQPHAVLLSPWHNLSFVLVGIERGRSSACRSSNSFMRASCSKGLSACADTRSRPLHAGFAPLKEYGSFRVRSVISKLELSLYDEMSNIGQPFQNGANH